MGKTFNFISGALFGAAAGAIIGVALVIVGAVLAGVAKTLDVA